MALGDGFGREQVMLCHSKILLYFIPYQGRKNCGFRMETRRRTHSFAPHLSVSAGFGTLCLQVAVAS